MTFAFLLIAAAVCSTAVALGWKLKTYKNHLFNLMYVLVCITYAAIIAALAFASLAEMVK